MASPDTYMTRASACLVLVMALCGCMCSSSQAVTLQGWHQHQQQELQQQQQQPHVHQVLPVTDGRLQRTAQGAVWHSRQQQALAPLPEPTPVQQQQQQQHRRLSQTGITLADINVPGIVRVTVPLPPKPPPGGSPLPPLPPWNDTAMPQVRRWGGRRGDAHAGHGDQVLLVCAKARFKYKM
jgi:hypothetical protein